MMEASRNTSKGTVSKKDHTDQQINKIIQN